VRSLPLSRWRRSISEAYARADATILGYARPEGSAALRSRIAEMLRRRRSFGVDEERILITNGATQAIDIATRLTVRPGEVAVVEDPSHTVMRRILGGTGAVVVPVPVDEDGLRVCDIDRHIISEGLSPDKARLVYVTPSLQFPTGTPTLQRSPRCPAGVGAGAESRGHRR